MNTASRSSRKGFSLLELMLAMTMVAILALTLYMSMSVALRARDSATASVDQMRSAVMAADLMRQDLESVLPPTGILAGQFVGTSLGGGSSEADDINFACLGSDFGNEQPMSDGIRRIELTVRTDVNPPVLVRRITRNLLATAQTEPEEEILCRNVRSFTVRYFDGTDWQDQWDSTTLGNVLPFAVELTLDVDNPPTKPGQPSTPYRVVRVVPLACAKLADTTQTQGATPQ